MPPPTLAPALAPAWRLLLTQPAAGHVNMAIDELLMTRAVSLDCWIVRVYGWSSATVSFGRNQAAAKAYAPAAIRDRGLAVVRRPTGGRAILHHREITYSVAAPLMRAGNLRHSYAAINQVLLEGLRRLGVAAHLSAEGPREMAPGLIPCFDHPSAGELVVGTRKLVGSAQWRSHDALLQHGSILVDDDQSALNALLLPSVAPPAHPPPAATLRDILGTPPSLEDVARSLFTVVRERSADTSDYPGDIFADPDLDALLGRYASDSWTWRR